MDFCEPPSYRPKGFGIERDWAPFFWQLWAHGTSSSVTPAHVLEAPSLETRYSWSSDDFPPADNLAFAKKTVMTRMHSDENPYRQYSGRAVDGNRNADGFWTNRHEPARWQVDLGKKQPIRKVVIFGNEETPRPFTVSVSEDEREYTPIKTVTARPRKNRWTIDTDIRARYVRIERPEPGRFSLKEVEVY